MSVEQSVAEVVTQGAGLVRVGAGISMGFGAIGAGIGIGLATKGLLEAIARQPEIANKAFGNFIIGVAFAEITALLSFVIAFLLLNFKG